MTEATAGAAGALDLVGAVARLLNSSDSKDAIGRVAELLRRGVPATSVTIWVRQPSGAAFTPFAAPPSPTPPFPRPTLEGIPDADATAVRLPLEHEGTTVGVLVLEGSGPGRAAPPRPSWPTCWPRTWRSSSSPRTSPSRWRCAPGEIEEQRRFTGARHRLACRWGCTWSTATTASRSGTASARRARRACTATRWSGGRCSRCSPGSRPSSSRRSSTRSSSRGRCRRWTSRWTTRRRGAYLPDQQDPDAPRRRRRSRTSSPSART